MITLVRLKQNNINNYIESFYSKTTDAKLFYRYEKETVQEYLAIKEERISLAHANCDFGDTELMNGEFVFMKYDFEKQQFTAKRDKVGVKPLFYINNSELLACSNSIFELKNLLKELVPNPSYIEKVLTGTAPLPDETFYQEIKRLPAAHQLTYKDDSLEIERYWSLKAKANSTVEQFSDLLFSAVEKRNKGKSGTELSGGIDSSGVTGVLASIETEKIESFRHVLNDNLLGKYFPFKDEREFSQSMIDFSGRISINNADSYMKGVIDELINEMRTIGSPFFSSMSLFSDDLYQKAKDQNIDTLYSGFGGDELVSSKSGFYRRELILSKNIKKLRELTNVNVFSFQNLKYIFRLAFPNIKLRKHWRNKQLNNHLLLVEPDISKIVKTELKEKNYRTLNEFLISKIYGHALLTRLEENSMSLRARGIDYTYPLLDVDLMESFLGLASDVKYNNKLPRSIYRQAIKSVTPEKIRKRNNKTGATVPTVFYRFMNDYDRIKELLNKYKQAKASKIVNIEKMELMLEQIKQKALGKVMNERVDNRIFILGLQMILYYDMDVLGDFKTNTN